MMGRYRTLALFALVGCAAPILASSLASATPPDPTPTVENWTPISGYNFGKEYASVIRSDGIVATLWDVIDFPGPTPTPAPSGPLARSLLSKIEVDCATHRWRELSAVAVSGSMGGGSVVADETESFLRDWVTPSTDADHSQIEGWCRLVADANHR
jgi:hypothetical protein